MKTQDLLKELFFEVAPNALTEEQIVNRTRLNQIPPDEIRTNLEELVDSKFLTKIPGPINRAGFSRTAYSITDIGSYPIKKTLEIGDISVQRFIDGDTGRAEDINQSFIAMQRVAQNIEQKITKDFNELQKNYWANQITIFGIFIAVFSMIVVSATKVSVPATGTLCEKVTNNVIELFPLALILLLFLFILKLMFRK